LNPPYEDVMTISMLKDQSFLDNSMRHDVCNDVSGLFAWNIRHLAAISFEEHFCRDFDLPRRIYERLSQVSILYARSKMGMLSMTSPNLESLHSVAV